MSDTNSSDFQPLNMVEQQLIAAAKGSVEQQKAFEKFIVDETLYVATPEVHREGMVSLQANTKIELLNVPLNDGRQAVAVFTAPQRVAEAFGEVGYLGLPGRALFEMIRAGPAILNPGQVYGVIWEPDAIASMLGLPAERTIQSDTQIMLGFPEDPPVDLIDHLKSELGAIPHVEAAWLALAAWPETGEQSWYLDVRTESTDHEQIRRALPAAIEGVDLKGRPVDMVINSPWKSDGTGISIVQRDDATRPKKGLLGRLFG